MGKQLDNIGNEAINDLNNIFDQVVVNKILSKSEQNQNKLITGISEIRKDLEFQDELLKDVKGVHGKIGTFSKDYYEDDENKDYHNDKNEINMSSVLKGLAKKSQGVETKLLQIKNLVGDPLDANKEVSKNNLFTLLQKSSDMNMDTLQKAKYDLQEHCMDKLQLEKELNKIQNNQVEITRQITDLLDSMDANEHNIEKRYVTFKDTFKTSVEELNSRLNQDQNHLREENRLIIEELNLLKQEANDKALIIGKCLKFLLGLGIVSVIALIVMLATTFL